MKFIVERTSTWGNGKPCALVKKETLLCIDERVVNDPLKITSMGTSDGWWYNKGKNHRVEHGHIKRDFDWDVWTIELNTLEELLQFRKDYGRIVIEPHPFNPGYLRLEIYDDWRE